ncbi:hypothetical protein EW145_g471 [Phellinidium pouzarii]|uniref:Histone deacetylase domain-containing protein n=1 Tax=Phellinidium pouzarii TaxID=167371 RepID=A0A4V3XDZ6_9AGAM|nr:hypothetical protein EW145_g471 [Phellinidium pouzarii]
MDLVQDVRVDVVDIIKSTSSVDVLNNEAVKFVHGDIEGDVYLKNLVKWARESMEKIKAGESEIPTHLSQGDLYLSPESLDAIQGALGTVCEAVDKITITSRGGAEQNASAHGSNVIPTNAFVAIRPPGHHCGEDTPSGFCFVNNVVVAAAHVQAASVSIHGQHGQHIENIHLQPYQSESDFWQNLYPTHYAQLLKKARAFVSDTDDDDVLVFVSCGFDASEHEYPSMSRHNRRVPVSFYHRFGVDAREFANEFARGKLISVLEGGYSDRALISGSMAHLAGLVEVKAIGVSVDEGWWKLENLILLEKSTKKRRGGKTSVSGVAERWLERTVAIFQSIETVIALSPSPVQPPLSMTLRERKPSPTHVASVKTSSQTPRQVKVKILASDKTLPSAAAVAASSESVDHIVKDLEGLSLKKQSGVEEKEHRVDKKLPRVILHVKDPEF